MKILKHGNYLRFKCEGCGCEWAAAKDECEYEEVSINALTKSFRKFGCDCPECGVRSYAEEPYANITTTYSSTITKTEVGDIKYPVTY